MNNCARNDRSSRVPASTRCLQYTENSPYLCSELLKDVKMTLEVCRQHSLNDQESEPLEVRRRKILDIIILSIREQERECLSGMMVL